MTTSTNTRNSRTRSILIAVLVFIILSLVGLTFLAARILAPVGGATGDPAVTGLEWIRSIYGYGEAEDQQLNAPVDTAIHPDGRIWVTDPARARILAFNPDGTYSTLIHQGPFGSSPEAMQSPNAVAVSEAGLVYIADFGREEILVYTADNQFVRSWEVPVPGAIDVRGDRVAVGTVYGIALFTLEGELVATLGVRGSGPEEFDNPGGVVIGEDGTLFIADTLNARIKAYSAEGDLLWISDFKEQVGEPGDEGYRPLMQIPRGITLDGQGRVIVLDPFTFTINVLDPEDGAFIAAYGDFGQRDGLFFYPTGISYDSARDWFAIADTNNNRMQIVRIPGTAQDEVLPALRRALVGPVWVLCIPLFFLLLLVIAGVLRRRALRRTEEATVS